MAAAKRRPPLLRTRFASISASSRSRRSVRWQRGPRKRTTSAESLSRSQAARVTRFSGDQLVRRGLLDVKGNRVDHVDSVTQVGQPGCIGPRPTPDVQYVEGAFWEEALDQFLGALELEGARVHASAKPILFDAAVVVVARTLVHVHAPIM